MDITAKPPLTVKDIMHMVDLLHIGGFHSVQGYVLQINEMEDQLLCE
jgi:hypothetical protein